MSDCEFQPVYITLSELGVFGLPQPAAVPDIMAKVAQASTLIDTWCQKQDSDGYGSLVFSTFTERVTLKANTQANVFRITKRPMIGVSASEIASLQASGMMTEALSGTQPYDNGAMASTETRLNAEWPDQLCAIVAISGRYGVSRNGSMFENMLPFINPLAVGTLYGGPPIWFALDPGQCDYNAKTGEIWAPPGIYLYQFTEMSVTYTAGFNPLKIPRNIKQACANIVKNMLTKPIPGMQSANYADAALNMTFSSTWIDAMTQGLLLGYRNIIYG